LEPDPEPEPGSVHFPLLEPQADPNNAAPEERVTLVYVNPPLKSLNIYYVGTDIDFTSYVHHPLGM
jgi:hypothetical protein